MKKEKFKSVPCMLLGAAFFLLPAFLLGGCSNEGDGLTDAGDAGLVELRIRAGSDAAATRAAFGEGTPVEILAYARQKATPEVEAFSGPARVYVAEGTASGAKGDGASLSEVTVARVNNEAVANGKLLVEAGYTYDIVVLVNASPRKSYTNDDGTEKSKFGVLKGTYVSGFAHGSDILAGRATAVRAENTGGVIPVEVSFTGDGTDGQPDAGGNLPHLGSAVKVEARLQQGVFDLLLADDKQSVSLGIDGVRFNYCLPSSANLPLGGGDNPRQMLYAVQVGGYNTSYTAEAVESGVVSVTAPYDESRPKENAAVSGDGYILPCPLKNASDGHNVMNLTFNLLIDGGGVVLTANNVELPEFKPGYRYTFVVEFGVEPGTEKGKIDLLLNVERWNSISWTGAEGGYDDGADRVLVNVGGWNGITYQIAEGGYGGDDRLIISVGGFGNVSWGGSEGRYENIPGKEGVYLILDNFTGVKWQTEEGRFEDEEPSITNR